MPDKSLHTSPSNLPLYQSFPMRRQTFSGFSSTLSSIETSIDTLVLSSPKSPNSKKISFTKPQAEPTISDDSSDDEYEEEESIAVTNSKELSQPSFTNGPEPPSRDLKHQPDSENELPKIKGSLFSYTITKDLMLMIPAFITTLAAGVSQPVQTILMGKVFTTLSKYAAHEYPSPQAFMHEVRILTMSMVGLSGALMLCHWTMVFLWDHLSSRQVHRAQYQTFHRFLGRDFAWYDKNKGIMGTLALLIRSFEEFRIATSLMLALNLRSLCCLASGLIIAFAYSWSLTFICICALPIIVIFTGVTAKPMSRELVQYKSSIESASSLVDWSISSIQTIKQFNTQHVQTKKFTKVLDTAFQHYHKFIIIVGLQQGISRLIMLSMFVPAFVYGGNLVSKGKLETGDVLTVFWSTMMLANSLSELGLRMESVHRGIVSSLRINEFLDLGISSATYFKSMIGLFPDTCQGSIVFKDVCFYSTFSFFCFCFFFPTSNIF